VAQEGAFGTFLLARDVCDPPLMFGPGGILEVSGHACLSRAGLGIDLRNAGPKGRTPDLKAERRT
jgi:hypothetical protein